MTINEATHFWDAAGKVARATKQSYRTRYRSESLTSSLPTPPPRSPAMAVASPDLANPILYLLWRAYQ